MTRKAAKVDSNQGEIVEYLRACGFTVTSTANVGNGFPDLVVGKYGLTFILEVKSKKGKLRKSQEEWFEDWRGHAIVVRNMEDVRKFICDVSGVPYEECK